MVSIIVLVLMLFFFFQHGLPPNLPSPITVSVSLFFFFGKSIFISIFLNIIYCDIYLTLLSPSRGSEVHGCW